jgi:hypothetical protein
MTRAKPQDTGEDAKRTVTECKRWMRDRQNKGKMGVDARVKKEEKRRKMN